MARIADKHGLTNAYRQVGTGKRVVKRGRPKKYLLGKSSKRKANYRSSYSSIKNIYTINEMDIDTNKQTTVIISIFFIILLIMFSLIPIFRCIIPIVMGAMLIFLGDKILKKFWKLSDDKWSKPASIGWTIFTCFTMIVMFFITLLVQIGEISSVALIVIICIYLLMSIVMLINKHKKLQKIDQTMKRFGLCPDDYVDYEDFDFDDISMIDCMDGHSFEYFCAEVLKKNGFVNVSVTKGSGDQGVDVLAEKGGIKYAVQCKNYSSALGNTPVQEVNAGKTFYNCHVGVVMTNSIFTPGAKELAQATGVLLWDRKVLQEMMGTLEC